MKMLRLAHAGGCAGSEGVDVMLGNGIMYKSSVKYY